MNVAARRPIPLVLFVAPVLALGMILVALGQYAMRREGSPSCDSRTIATWHDGARTYALLHDFGPVSDLAIDGTVGETWEIRAVSAPRSLPIIQLGTVPPGYRAVNGGDAFRWGTFVMSASGTGGSSAVGVGRPDDPQRQAMVGSIMGGQRRAAAHCYPVP